MKPSRIDKKTIDLDYGRIAYLETGGEPKPPVLFVHGIPTSSYLWREPLRFLQNDFHCYAPDLMGLGDTVVDPTRDIFHMEAQAEMLVELMEELGHERFAIVCHDQGGAAAQLIAARQPHRITCFGITNCVCYDNWPVPPVRKLQQLSRLGPVTDLASRSGLLELVLTRGPMSPIRRGLYRRDKFDPAVWSEYLRPLRGTRDERARMVAFLMAGHPRHTLQAVAGLKRFTAPTMVVWPGDDAHLSPSWGRKLYEDIPGARRFEIVPFCGHFWQEERPSEFSSLLGQFLAEHLLREPEGVRDDRGASTALPAVQA
ncbi:MAG: alpha/beta hydrolase [Deltaproteobacteria bacterium]|jgi:pimeloyl-ACP methyl ester carboxylesterase|nr:alpha/beta hydrolase [Deltaproteobacteria bacterium]MBW2532740.1 alpha/beta hydrolase [Deltaproteobacteria bacterium]